MGTTGGLRNRSRESRERVRAASRHTFRSLASRNFRLFFIGQGLSQSGMWMQTIATAAVVLDLTDSGFTLGIIVAAQWGPLLVVGPWAGALADRHDRRSIILCSQIGGFVAASAFAAVVMTDHATVPLAFLLSGAMGVVNAVETPARIALAGDLVDEDDVANAVGLNASLLTGARVFGPILAGLIIAGPGVSWCFVLHALSKIPQTTLLKRLDAATIRGTRSPKAKGQVRAGLRHIWENHELRFPLSLMAVTAFFAFNYTTVLPLLAEREFGGGPTTYSVLFAAMSFGSVIGGLVLARRTATTMRQLAFAAGGLGCAWILLAAASTRVTGALLAVPVGLFYLLLGGGVNAMLQAASAPELRGRVLAMLPIVSNGLSPFGGPLIGWLSDQIGVRAAIVVTALPCILAAAIVASPFRLRGTVPATVIAPAAADATSTVSD